MPLQHITIDDMDLYSLLIVSPRLIVVHYAPRASSREERRYAVTYSLSSMLHSGIILVPWALPVRHRGTLPANHLRNNNYSLQDAKMVCRSMTSRAWSPG